MACPSARHNRAEGAAAAPLFDDAPIGVFDSGYGGLTVLREIMRTLPDEDIVFVGDSARCPYGTRELAEVRGFVLQICSYLVERGCKMVVLACNTATAAGLEVAQRTFSVPIVGVVQPGARAAVHMTRNRRVGVVATQATVDSGAYTAAIRNLDAGIEVFSAAAPRFVSMVEQGIKLVDAADADASDVFGDARYAAVAEGYLGGLRDAGIDTLVLGCTHYPLIGHLIARTMGDGVALVSSAEEAALDVRDILARKRACASKGRAARIEFLTTADDVEAFRRFGQHVLGSPLENVSHVVLPDGPFGERDGVRS